jgi:hypothetical protein
MAFAGSQEDRLMIRARLCRSLRLRAGRKADFCHRKRHFDKDDAVRANYIPEVLSSLKSAIDDGIPVIGYMHWSLLIRMDAGLRSTVWTCIDRPTAFPAHAQAER